MGICKRKKIVNQAKSLIQRYERINMNLDDVVRIFLIRDFCLCLKLSDAEFYVYVTVANGQHEYGALKVKKLKKKENVQEYPKRRRRKNER